jgi:cytolysin-activating lysine-acyltransferase
MSTFGSTTDASKPYIWAAVENGKDKLVNQGGQMQWDDWNSGDLLLFNDFVAPFGHTKEILKDLRSQTWPHEIAFSLRRAEDGSVKKVNYWWHKKDYKKTIWPSVGKV